MGNEEEYDHEMEQYCERCQEYKDELEFECNDSSYCIECQTKVEGLN